MQKFQVVVEKDLKCMACGSDLAVELQGLFDTRFGIEKSWDIYRCTNCGIEHTIPTPLPDELKRLYETYYNFGGDKDKVYNRFRKLYFSSKLYRLWLAIDGDISFTSQKGSGRLLDVGCNEGRGLDIYRQNGFDPVGLELNEVAAMEAREKGFAVSTQLLELFQPEQLYDIVVLSNVLEHSIDPKIMLTHVNRVLKTCGQIWISCPNIESWQRIFFGRYWINWHVPFHISFFSGAVLKKLLNDSGFEVTKIKYVTPSLWMAQSIIVRLFARPGLPTKQIRNPFLVASLMLLIRCFFFPVLWLGNLVDRGDCFIVEARKR